VKLNVGRRGQLRLSRPDLRPREERTITNPVALFPDPSGFRMQFDLMERHADWFSRYAESPAHCTFRSDELESGIRQVE
jgi:hypothetical protein